MTLISPHVGPFVRIDRIEYDVNPNTESCSILQASYNKGDHVHDLESIVRPTYGKNILHAPKKPSRAQRTNVNRMRSERLLHHGHAHYCKNIEELKTPLRHVVAFKLDIVGVTLF